MEATMADSTLQHDTNTPPAVTKGHGTKALGPSDSSDSGSDIQGKPGGNAGALVGDANLDSDSDRNGTGERGAAGRDEAPPVDTILRDERGEVIEGEDIGDEEDTPE
jgi:hypothetical protein